ncbi:MAG: phosphatase PAP2 family protein [Myxococcales bacterium]|nr:phosphatase PAP2 family protein [Myxococcales bacterium]
MEREGRWRSAARWLGGHELGTLLSVCVLAGGLLVFVVVAGEVSDGSTRSLDQTLLLAFRNPDDPSDPIGPRWVEEIARDLTALGGVALLTLLSVAVVAHLVLQKKARAGGFVAVSVLGALALSTVLKSSFDRPRPDLVPHLSHVASASFPSGHSMLSAAVYLTLGALLARFQDNLVQRAHVLAWAVLLTLLVGTSRVYVGVHWPTDVLAGWAAGAAWASLCWLAARALQRKGRVEAPR